MGKRLITTIVTSTLALVAASGAAFADVVARYECTIIGTNSPEPVGDREGHALVASQFTCVAVDGLLKGAALTGLNTTEWDGARGPICCPAVFTAPPEGRWSLRFWKAREPSS
ncbi:hypothetical protein [Bradyrhizobium sp.]|uniref:hypothetical protein n=1 Tax=Bradyrhizobium sp. TaxID=376 RepID=UPI00344FB45A